MLASAVANRAATELVELLRVQAVLVPLSAQGWLRVKSAVRLSCSELGGTGAVVSILMVSCWLALTYPFAGVTDMMRWP